MDLNIFFREATMRICSSLNLEKAMQSTLEYVGRYMPADSLLIGLINPYLGVSRNLVHIGPDDWPKRLGTVPLPRSIINRLIREWETEPKCGILNDPLQEEPDLHELHHLFWPDEVSLLHTDLALESKKIAILMLAARGKHKYTEEHVRMIISLNEPFCIAMANALQYEEAVRLKEMLEDDKKYLQSELRSVSGDRIIGADFGLKQVMRLVRQVAPQESPVLLLGETGTGKELLANALHSASSRSSGPFIKVNCGGLPESLVDSELFGHEKGAFTGAISQNRGRFERAHGGTIFLDEIGELPLNVQTRLLRVLQHREIERVGGNKTIPVDVRIISATHQNLELMVGRGRFREDLWYRLNVFPIMIPPLRQRPQDMPALLDHIISRKCRDLKITNKIRVQPGTVERLRNHHWPGNVRELENLVERTLIQARAANPESDVLTISLDPGAKQDLRMGPVHAGKEPFASFDEAASLHIRKALDLTDGKITGQGGAAETLMLNPSTLRGKMRKLGINP
jgi:transcriptional regulator with GAF, ATPase, and Fis domain